MSTHAWWGTEILQSPKGETSLRGGITEKDQDGFQWNIQGGVAAKGGYAGQKLSSRGLS